MLQGPEPPKRKNAQHEPMLLLDRRVRIGQRETVLVPGVRRRNRRDTTAAFAGWGCWWVCVAVCGFVCGVEGGRLVRRHEVRLPPADKPESSCLGIDFIEAGTCGIGIPMMRSPSMHRCGKTFFTRSAGLSTVLTEHFNP